MADETKGGTERGAGLHGEERVEVLANQAPRMVSFNEKTGKATRDSHLNVPIDTPAPDTVLPLPDAAGESGAPHEHTVFATPVPAGATERVTLDPNRARDTTVFGSPEESASGSRVQPPPDQQKTDTRVTIEQALPQRSTVFVPVPGKAEIGSLRETAEHPAGRSGASPAGSAAAAQAPAFVPGLPVTTTIVHAPPASDSASQKIRLDPAPEPKPQASNHALHPPSGGPGLQHATSAARQGQPGVAGEPAPADPLPKSGPAAAPPVAASRTATISISGAAVERLHSEEKKTLELNKQLDQLAARLTEHRR
jgi:hypothetical protein